jgi:hypothetical protein
VAVRNEVDSTRTEPQCVETLQQAGPEAPPTPGEVAATAAEENKARVSWQDASNGEASHVILRNGTVVAEVAAPVAEALVDTVDGENCFSVQAKSEQAVSEPSPESCITVAAGSAPAGGGAGGAPVVLPSGGGGGTGTGEGEGQGEGEGEGGNTTSAGLGVIAVINPPYAVDDIAAEERAVARRDELRGQGHDAQLLDTRDFPALTRESGNFFFVYVPGFSSETEAEEYCSTNSFACIYFDLSSGSDATGDSDGGG